MLTIDRLTESQTLVLAPSNLVTRTLYLDEARRLLLPDGADRSRAAEPARTLTRTGDIGPLLSFIEDKLLPVFSRRDYRWMNELAVRTAFLTLLFDDVNYVMQSEPELGRGYADLCLVRRPDARSVPLFDLLFEFKYLALKTVGMSSDELARLSLDELARREPVRAALDEAETQLGRYRARLVAGDGSLRLRSYAVVALGFERLVAREVTGD